MCWALVSKNIPEEKLSKRGIKVFKVVRNDLRSVFYKFKYKVGETYCLDGRLGVSRQYTQGRRMYLTEINEGFHSYSHKLGIIGGTVCLKSSRRAIGVFHSCDVVVIECTIPKHTVYYYNPNTGEYVSNKIRVDMVKNVSEYMI